MDRTYYDYRYDPAVRHPAFSKDDEVRRMSMNMRYQFKYHLGERWGMLLEELGFSVAQVAQMTLQTKFGGADGEPKVYCGLPIECYTAYLALSPREEEAFSKVFLDDHDVRMKARQDRETANLWFPTTFKAISYVHDMIDDYKNWEDRMNEGTGHPAPARPAMVQLKHGGSFGDWPLFASSDGILALSGGTFLRTSSTTVGTGMDWHVVPVYCADQRRFSTCRDFCNGVNDLSAHPSDWRWNGLTVYAFCQKYSLTPYEATTEFPADHMWVPEEHVGYVTAQEKLEADIKLADIKQDTYEKGASTFRKRVKHMKKMDTLPPKPSDEDIIKAESGRVRNSVSSIESIEPVSPGTVAESDKIAASTSPGRGNSFATMTWLGLGYQDAASKFGVSPADLTAFFPSDDKLPPSTSHQSRVKSYVYVCEQLSKIRRLQKLHKSECVSHWHARGGEMMASVNTPLPHDRSVIEWGGKRVKEMAKTYHVPMWWVAKTMKADHVWAEGTDKMEKELQWSRSAAYYRKQRAVEVDQDEAGRKANERKRSADDAFNGPEKKKDGPGIVVDGVMVPTDIGKVIWAKKQKLAESGVEQDVNWGPGNNGFRYRYQPTVVRGKDGILRSNVPDLTTTEVIGNLICKMDEAPAGLEEYRAWNALYSENYNKLDAKLKTVGEGNCEDKMTDPMILAAFGMPWPAHIGYPYDRVSTDRRVAMNLFEQWWSQEFYLKCNFPSETWQEPLDCSATALRQRVNMRYYYCADNKMSADEAEEERKAFDAAMG